MFLPGTSGFFEPSRVVPGERMFVGVDGKSWQTELPTSTEAATPEAP